jgi:hypothetical protein
VQVAALAIFEPGLLAADTPSMPLLLELRVPLAR